MPPNSVRSVRDRNSPRRRVLQSNLPLRDETDADRGSHRRRSAGKARFHVLHISGEHRRADWSCYRNFALHPGVRGRKYSAGGRSKMAPVSQQRRDIAWFPDQSTVAGQTSGDSDGQQWLKRDKSDYKS